MTDADRRRLECPDDETLAAFVDGRLAPDARARVEAHVADCEDCSEVLAEMAAALTPAGEAAPIVGLAPALSRARRRVVWYVATAIAAAAAVAAFVLLPGWLRGPGSRGEIAELVGAIGSERPVEARLAGFPYGPVSSAIRAGGATPEPRPELQIAVAHLQKRVQEQRTAPNLAAYGVGAIAIGRLDDGVRALEESVALESTAEAWNDLGAAYLARGADRDHAVDLPRAVDAERAALRLRPTLAEGQFNLALALEALHLTRDAIEAWQHYLTIDPSSAWADEAKRHLAALRAVSAATPPSAPQWRDELFGRVLVDWTAAGDPQRASDAEQQADRLAQSLAAVSADRLPQDAVQAVRRADPAARVRLREGHRAFADGQDRYRRSQFADATAAFERAATDLAAGGSPFELSARFWAATSQYQGGDAAGARVRLLGVVSAIGARPYSLVRGRCEWTLGVIEVGLGHEAAGGEHYALATVALHEAGDFESEAYVRQLIAENLNTLGQQAQSWNIRLPALAVDTRNGGLLSAAQAARQSGWLGAAHAFLDEAVAKARNAGQMPELADALRARAIVDARDGDDAAATRDLADARQVAVGKVAGWDRLMAEIDAAEAQVSGPGQAEQGRNAATRAIAYFSGARLVHRLPVLYGARARLLRAAGRGAEAEADLREGLQLLESERDTVSRRDLRASFGDDLRDLTDALVALDLDKGDAEGAFAAVERTRAADLLRVEGATPAPASLREIETALGPGVTMACYHVGTSAVTMWIVTGGRMALATSPVGATELARLVRAFSDDPSGPAGAKLRSLLLDPVDQRAGSEDLLVVVPDGPLGILPFAALPGGTHGFVVEERAVAVLPSAGWVVRASRPAGTAPPAQITAVGDPRIDRRRFPDLPDLPGARAEALAAARAYPRSTVLTGEQATREALLALLPSSEVLHFAGHTLVNDVRPFESQLVVWDGGGRALTAGDLADLRLARTRLVVLAACSSANGLLTRSEGALGLARMILAIGVPTVVASDWPVDDRASLELFSRFHARYANTGDAVLALRDAQLSLLRSSDPLLRKPSAWGGYVAIGGAVGSRHLPQRS